MKKITLLMLIMFIWGCSQAQDQEAAAKQAVAETAEAVKDEAIEKANELTNDQVEAVAEKAVEEAAEAVGEVKEAVAVVDEVVEDVVAQVVEKTAAYQAGVHYQVINPAYDTGINDEVVVYEFFGYPCPHCASFEPYMKKLESEMPENAKLVRIPVVFGKQWEPFAQAYYAFEAMGIVDEVHGPMFEAIHQHKKQFRTIDSIAVWVASSFGVDKDKFLSTAKSFVVDGQVRKGMKMLQAMGVTSTPTLVTNGKFMPKNEALKSRNDIIEITQFLVNQELDSM